MSARSVARARSACSWRRSLHSRSAHGAAISTTPARTARDGQPDVPDGGERTAPGGEDDQPGEGEETAEGEPGCAEPAGARRPTQPPAPLGVVELGPRDDGADGHHQQRDQEAEPEVETGVLRDDHQPRQEQHPADQQHARRRPLLVVAGAADRRSRVRDASARPLRPRGVHGHPAAAALDHPLHRLGGQRPEEEVGHEAGPWQGEQDKDQPDEPHLQPEVEGQPRAHAADDPSLDGAVEGAHGPLVACGRGGGPVGPLVRSRHAHIFAHVRPGNERIQGRSALPQGPVRVDPHGEGRLPKEAWLP